MEKFRLSKEILRLFYRTKLLSQVRLLQNSQLCSSSKDGSYSSSDTSDSSDSSGSDSDTEIQPKKTHDFASLLGVMKVQKTYKKPADSQRNKTPGRLFKKLEKNQGEEREGLQNKSGKTKRISLLESLQQFQQPESKNELPEISIEPELADAVKSVAEALPGDVNKTESDLLRQLKRHDEATTAGKRGETLDISDMFASLKVRQEPTQPPLQRRSQASKSDRRHTMAAEREIAMRRTQQTETVSPPVDSQQDDGMQTESDLLKQQKVTSAQELRKDEESDLLKQLRKHDGDPTKDKDGESADFSDLISGLKIQQEPQEPPHQRRGPGYDTRNYGDAFKMDTQEPISLNRYDHEFEERVQRGQIRDAPYQRQRKRSLFNRRRLEIFTPETDGQITVTDTDVAMATTGLPSIWEMEREKELEAIATPPPKNGFEEMIQWTKEGKLWIYPIDNEQGLDEEKSVGFHEHVFLEHLLKGFPKKGPLRHFMELVVTGLSKNAYITVQQKKDHVEWFRQYFKEKEDVLREAGALPERKQIQN
ncbi:uncharacterized protein LOC144432869 [Glandiceps talaboti]